MRSAHLAKGEREREKSYHLETQHTRGWDEMGKHRNPKMVVPSIDHLCVLCTFAITPSRL